MSLVVSEGKPNTSSSKKPFLLIKLLKKGWFSFSHCCSCSWKNRKQDTRLEPYFPRNRNGTQSKSFRKQKKAVFDINPNASHSVPTNGNQRIRLLQWLITTIPLLRIKKAMINGWYSDWRQDQMIVPLWTSCFALHAVLNMLCSPSFASDPGQGDEKLILLSYEKLFCCHSPN